MQIAKKQKTKYKAGKKILSHTSTSEAKGLSSNTLTPSLSKLMLTVLHPTHP